MLTSRTLNEKHCKLKNLTLRQAALYNWNNTSDRATSNELVGHVFHISGTLYVGLQSSGYSALETESYTTLFLKQ
jgi:hypothetical protein